MDELLTQFLIEGRDLTSSAEVALGRLTRAPDDVAAFDALFRDVHTLKGSVALFDMAPAEALLHRAEDRLMAAQMAGTPIAPALVETLVLCIDEIDRWIDELERSGRIGDDAGERSARLIARLTGKAAAPDERTEEAGVPGSAEPSWLAAVRARLAPEAAQAGRVLTAFRYIPDADCFFRGDDPLAVAASVPDLVDLVVMPHSAWVPLDSWDPFRCSVVLEGVSTAPLEAIRAAFRLVPDQVAFAAIAPRETQSAFAIEGAVDPADGAATGRLVRVDGARLDTLATEVGELVVAANSLAFATRRAAGIDADFAASLRTVQANIDRIAGRLHRSVSAVRRVSLAGTLRRLPRLVREIAEGVAKPVAFTLRGETTEVDKAIADGLFEPLIHLVRNALDHGLETQEGRAAAGKPVEGRLAIDILRQGDEVVLAVSDDGAGIDPVSIRRLGVARGLIDAEAAEGLSDAQALRLILAPGFSTATAVTDLSGRGVGMDAVQAAVERLRGRIVIESVLGEGTRIELRLPLDAITTRLLIVRAGSARYGVPLDQIVETARIAADDIMTVGTGEACVLRDRTIPVVDLARLLEGHGTEGTAARLVLTESAGETVAVRVAGFESQIDAMVRETSGLLATLPGVAGTALLGDGQVLLVLDLPELV
ncbi:MAG: chemotaxis protein CheA [Rhizorhabdus sp.]